MTSCPFSSSYSSYRASRSASRIFWIITCLAVCAPMRSAISSGSSGTPLWVPRIEPSVRSILTTMSCFFAVVLLGGGDQRRFDALEDDLLVDILIAVDRVDDPQNLVRIHKSLSVRRASGVAWRFRIVGSVSAGMASTVAARRQAPGRRDAQHLVLRNVGCHCSSPNCLRADGSLINRLPAQRAQSSSLGRCALAPPARGCWRAAAAERGFLPQPSRPNLFLPINLRRL